MRYSLILTILTSFWFFNTEGQELDQQPGSTEKVLELTAAGGSYRGSFSLSYFHTAKLGKAKRFGLSAGLRLTSFIGANIYYITAPAELTSGSTSPLILFKENITENIDSLLVKAPQINSLNLMINLQYRVNERLTAGFNIDVVGVSFGRKTRGNYINGYAGKNTHAEPTPLNLLLISDNDRGSLNSELYGRYKLNTTWDIKAGLQFLFTEYTTVTKVQESPKANDRFRNKALLFAAGITYKIK
jgi:hypothetical protein